MAVLVNVGKPLQAMDKILMTEWAAMLMTIPKVTSKRRKGSLRSHRGYETCPSTGFWLAP